MRRPTGEIVSHFSSPFPPPPPVSSNEREKKVAVKISGILALFPRIILRTISISISEYVGTCVSYP